MYTCVSRNRSPNSSLGMMRSLTENPEKKGPLLVGFKGRRNHNVGARFEREEAEDRASVGEGDGSHLLLDDMETILSVLLHLWGHQMSWRNTHDTCCY